MAKGSTERSHIDVIVRKRPLNELEIARGDRDVVLCNENTAIIEEIKLRIDGTAYVEQHEFRVDRFYDEKTDNQLIYEEYVKPLLEFAFEEQKTCSCFTYGQTGSGKTFTMIGSRKLKTFDYQYMPGVYEYAANDIYRMLHKPEYAEKLEVVISFYEIYCGKIYDLLQDRKLLDALDNGKREVIIKDLAVRQVTCKEDLIDHMLGGLALRRIGQNSQNDQSSRSHAILRIELRNTDTFSCCGRIVFIDLAGSERGADCINQPKQTQMDGAGINRSLLALKECIRAMDLEKTHIPFRDSELTKVLRDIFVGGSRNLMIANICPSNVSCEQTLNTLRYASRVKNFRQASINSGIGDSERDSAAASRITSARSGYSLSGVMRSQITTGNTAKSLSISPRLLNISSGATSKVPISSQRINKNRGIQNLSNRNLVTRRSVDGISPRESIKSTRETSIPLSGRSKGSMLPKPFENATDIIKSQFPSKVPLQEILDQIVLNPGNEQIYNDICRSLAPDVAMNTRQGVTSNDTALEQSLDALRKAEEISNHVSLEVIASNDSPDLSQYPQFIKNKIRTQIKPLLYLKQALDEYSNRMQVDEVMTDG
ncbi:kinesin-related protein 6 [Babesia gibsoni]|uniref:Kinesin-like protein n=1 Tax=Babesia gibsoni TaxID=33632 RepID=A0AAD8PEI1_BABGI|nr:kinesin-related protein 6 [Babesia gibsoni]